MSQHDRRLHAHPSHCGGPQASAAAKNQRALWWVLFLSGTYLVAEVVGAYWSGSLTLLADAGHMAIDTGAIALGLFAIWIAQRPATDRNTFGYYRAEILAALVNAVALVVISGFIINEAVERLSSPPEVAGGLMTGVATGGLIVNLIALYVTHSGVHHSLNLRGVWLHILGDTLGSVGAIVAGILVWWKGWYLADPIISLALALFILVGAFRLLGDCVNVLLEAAPRGMDTVRLAEGIASQEGVIDVHDLHVWTLTSGFVSLSAHVCITERVEPGGVLRNLTAYIQKEHGIKHVTLQLEPPDFRHRSTDCHAQS